jgi:hypothetical protein
MSKIFLYIVILALIISNVFAYNLAFEFEKVNDLLVKTNVELFESIVLYCRF